MSSRVQLALCLVLTVAASCRTAVDTAKEGQTLLARDREWARLSSAGKSPDSVLAFWTEDARVVMPGQATLQGKAPIGQMVTSSLRTPGFHVTWTPDTAVVSEGGDLGYTTGTNEFTVPDSAGKTTKIAGRYLTVWRKGSDGIWRCVEDYSTPLPPPVSATK
jgi:ketosteroid isomerase-like protein